MTFIEFKKRLLDGDITLPKFAKLVKISEKNLQSYKKKGEVPNLVAVAIESFAIMKENNLNYKDIIENLNLKNKKKEGVGFQKNPQNVAKRK